MILKDIKKETSLTDIGSTVNIDLQKINDNISSDLIVFISKYPYGEVVDYRITDGTGIGLVLKLEDGRKIWFFNDEIANSTLLKENIKKVNSSYSLDPLDMQIANKDLFYVFNPFNLIKWLSYSLKDVL